MAQNGYGGYRAPEHPAAVSGPGALSARTDGGPTQAPMLADGGPYGSRKDMQEIQSGAAMQGTPQVTPAMLPSLTDPTSRPDEPVTAGADAGPGISAAAAGIASTGATEIDDTTRQRLLGALPTLLWLASQPQASEQTRQFVRQLRGDL